MQIRGDCINEFSKSKRIGLSDDSEILLRCDRGYSQKQCK